MKKQILFFAIALIVIVVPATTLLDTDADAEEWEEGGIAYQVNSEEPMTVVVVQYTEKVYSGNVVIPETVKHDDGSGEKTYAVTSISAGAFNSCISLTSVTIPNNVTSIGLLAFAGCNSLSDVYVNSTSPPSLGGGSFQNCPETMKVYVPDASLGAYKASSWANLTPDGALTSNMISIPDIVSGLVYNGTLQKGMIESSDDLYTLSGNTAVNAGDHTATASLREGSNFVWSDGTTGDKQLSWSIAKKQVTVSGITAQNKAYDGNTDAILVYDGIVINGLVPGDDLSVTAKGTFDNAYVGNGKTVNISDIVLVGASSSNYVLAPAGNQTSTTADITNAPEPKNDNNTSLYIIVGTVAVIAVLGCIVYFVKK